jgi:hypothetical protein
MATVFLLFLLLGLIPKDCYAHLCYRNYQEISDKVITGRWLDNSDYTNRASFVDEVTGRPTCPIHHTSSVLFCHDLPQGKLAANRKFVPDDCELDEFQPSTFLSLLRNRRLLFAGDSVTSQHFNIVFCSLFSHSPNTQWYYSAFPGQQTGVTYFPEYNATILFVQDYLETLTDVENILNHYISAGNVTSPEDILVLNFGLHFHTSTTILPYLEELVFEWGELQSPFERPILLWRETSPQHFNSSDEPELPMGYHVSLTKDPFCVPLEDYNVAYKQDFRNRLANHFVGGANIPVMRIYNVTRSQWDVHMGLHYRNKFTDCTHSCAESGTLYYYRDLFYNILPLLIEEKQKEMTNYHSTNHANSDKKPGKSVSRMTKKFGISGERK